MAFEQRHLDFTFQLGKGSFGGSGYDTDTFTGLRASVSIAKAGGVSLPLLEARIWGMTLSAMNQLSTLGKPIAQVRDNLITIGAYSGNERPNIVFSGTIMNAWVDMLDAPNGAFTVSAVGALIQAMKPIPPSSFQGSADVATILQGLASQMGYAFENNGVSVQLANPYFPGTAIAQAQAAARAAHINMVIDDGTMAIWPMGGNRAGTVPLISAATGMVNYPAHTQNGISLTTLYRPTLVFGSQVQVDSILTPAQGKWTIFSVRHDLESELPDGKWFTSIECAQNGQPVPIA